ncbi:hypothetical protein RB195_025230 [Necator americanus]|uniref:Uncharacterized protein n=1 Tax=Necator americanus TaxID=51031 RepID=A0ABR1ERF7_NECAM
MRTYSGRTVPPKYSSPQFVQEIRCVLCGDGILSSIETEKYARAGAVKRTLVHFIAKEKINNIACNIRVLDCCGCAERSCERRQPLLMFPAVTHSLVYPVVITRGPSFPLWLLFLLIPLLLICLLSLCLIPFLVMRQRRKAAKTEAFEKSRGIGVETEKTVVKDTGVGCKNVHLDNGAFYRVRPAVAVEDQEPITRTTEVFAKEQRRVCVTPEEDSFRTAFNGVRERARSTEADAISAANFHDHAVSTDSSSYRNYAYQRDIGGVAPVEGFDRVETSAHIFRF